MNSSTIRRLAADQASIRKSIPPNYLFPDGDEGAALPDDLTQLTILLTGAQGTPYSNGLWRLHLRMPEDYPKNPPKATFKTKIYHPNVEESTGAVCLDTLKRDWRSKLTLRDILVTISCLLIHPNPDSALNAAAGALLQEDFEAFARQARLMTSVHASVPAHMKNAVLEAKHRGEEGEIRPEETLIRPNTSRAASSSSSLTMKKSQPASGPQPLLLENLEAENQAYADEDHREASKENDPSQSPVPVSPPPLSATKNIHGKRPLSELPTPTDSEVENPLDNGGGGDLTRSEKNVLAGQQMQTALDSAEPVRKSPKLARPPESKQTGMSVQIYEDAAISTIGSRPPSNDKENISLVEKTTVSTDGCKATATTPVASTTRQHLRKVSNVGATRGKQQARTGVRRL